MDGEKGIKRMGHGILKKMPGCCLSRNSPGYLFADDCCISGHCGRNCGKVSRIFSFSFVAGGKCFYG
jgi:hypothetical protein